MVEAACLALEWLSLRFHQQKEAMEEVLFIIKGLIMAVVVAALLRLQVLMEHLKKAEAVALLLLQAAATALLAQPQRRHRSA